MKTLVFVLILISTTIFSVAREKKSDEAQIKETILNYIEGFYEANPDRMSKALHPELAKRSIWQGPEGNSFIKPATKSLIVHVTRMQKNNKAPEMNPDQKFKAKIKIFDIEQNSASAKVSTNKLNFFDYIHLVKYNGEWKILNVLWEPYKKK